VFRQEARILEVDYTARTGDPRTTQEFPPRARSASVQGSRYAFGNDFVHILPEETVFFPPHAFSTTLAKYRESLLRGSAEDLRSSTIVSSKGDPPDRRGVMQTTRKSKRPRTRRWKSSGTDDPPRRRATLDARKGSGMGGTARTGPTQHWHPPLGSTVISQTNGHWNGNV